MMQLDNPKSQELFLSGVVRKAPARLLYREHPVASRTAAAPPHRHTPPATAAAAPLLSICVPTYHRPALLAQALRSVGNLSSEVEILVSDNSTANALGELVTRHVLADQPPTQWRYYRNPPGGTIATNWNHCLDRARGQYILMLHDDDYLLPDGLATILATLRQVRHQYQAVLFGVHIVNGKRQFVRQQTVEQARYLAPNEAVELVLTDSSLVRMPAIVVSKSAYLSAGRIDVVQRDTDDTDIWMRVFAQAGVYRVPAVTAAYAVHDGALTMGMFNEANIQLLLRIFQKAQQERLLTAGQLERAKARYFHQFVLAGTYRALRRRDTQTAGKILDLFDSPSLRPLPVSSRWLPVRVAFRLFTWLPWSLPLLPKL